MSFESAEAVTAAAVGIAAAILAWNRWITADSMLFGLLLAGLIGLAVAGVVFLVCKVFSYYRKKRHPGAPVVSFFSSEGGMLIASPLNANKKYRCPVQNRTAVFLSRNLGQMLTG